MGCMFFKGLFGSQGRSVVLSKLTYQEKICTELGKWQFFHSILGDITAYSIVAKNPFPRTKC